MLILISNKLVSNESKDCYTSVTEIPESDVALLLGTAKYRKNGGRNLYYRYRMEAAVKLFKAGKVKAIICSGDNATRYYDEPSTMKADLVKMGVPASLIYLDFAGFRTLDSVVRSKEIFSQTSITVVSQSFHNERALYIAYHKGIKAIGFNAQDVTRSYGLKTQAREFLARVKTILDIHFLNTEPKFLGEKIRINF
ncbi:vancomycin high temperature exclusion protein [Cryomorpha ignava]|uniref:Vancomycin high temperature exclusion protein n=2 Tax=Cryomorpha ignava TaxID=101383 RepID=A0A7K3WSZ0_9FLAO|nr:vancomycin high temperature exclusion protein [Cryomorpha ignava]